MQKRLNLKLNEPEIRETKEGVEFLGITIYPDRLALSEKKQNALFDKIKLLDWQEIGFENKWLKSLQGIKRYYATLLPEEYLQHFDEILEARLRELIKDRL